VSRTAMCHAIVLLSVSQKVKERTVTAISKFSVLVSAAFLSVSIVSTQVNCQAAEPSSANSQSDNQSGKQADLLKVGTKAPDFTRKASNGERITLKKFRHKNLVVLYFYPKDETPGCTKEACGFRDSYESLKKMGVKVIGVSGDSNDAHQAFASHHSLRFALLSDSNNSLLNLYGVPLFKESMHKRVTFVIDKEGTIADVIQDTSDGAEHVTKAITALTDLEKHETNKTSETH